MSGHDEEEREDEDGDADEDDDASDADEDDDASDADEDDAGEEEDDADEDDADEDDADEDEEPIPGEGTAAGDTLRAALRAFDAGDFVQVRALTKELESAEDADVRSAATALAARIAVDPIQIVVILACAAFLFAVIYRWIL